MKRTTVDTASAVLAIFFLSLIGGLGFWGSGLLAGPLEAWALSVGAITSLRTGTQ